MQTYFWNHWLISVSPQLEAGHHLAVPGYLMHPARVGFAPLDFAEPVGQLRDWVLRLAGGRRLHAHEFPDGSVRLHLDQHDPDAGPLKTVAHLALETTPGKVLLVLGTLFVAGAALKAATR